MINDFTWIGSYQTFLQNPFGFFSIYRGHQAFHADGKEQSQHREKAKVENSSYS